MIELISKIHYSDNAAILAQLPDKSLDLILEDLPYNTTKLKFEYAVDLKAYWAERLRVIKDNGAIILTSQQPFTTDLIVSNRKLFRYEIIWEKTMFLGFLNANKMPLRGHENILIFYKKLPTYNPQKTFNNREIGHVRSSNRGRYSGYGDHTLTEYVDDGTRFPSTVLRVSNQNGAIFGRTKDVTKHPTQKPVELFSWLIRTYTNEGDLVFDGFSGSGTTAISCLRENRKFIVCEWNKEYFDSAEARLIAEREKLASQLNFTG